MEEVSHEMRFRSLDLSRNLVFFREKRRALDRESNLVERTGPRRSRFVSGLVRIWFGFASGLFPVTVAKK